MIVFDTFEDLQNFVIYAMHEGELADVLRKSFLFPTSKNVPATSHRSRALIATGDETFPIRYRELVEAFNGRIVSYKEYTEYHDFLETVRGSFDDFVLMFVRGDPDPNDGQQIVQLLLPMWRTDE